MWLRVLEELKKPFSGGPFSVEAADVLCGSMWGLNFRYTVLDEVFKSDSMRDALFKYSIERLEKLIDGPDIPFQPRDIERCRVGFGTYGWKYDHGIIEKAVDLNVQLIDTAEGYGFGRVEDALGLALRKIAKPVSVATKVRRDHMSPEALRASVYRSIKKLGRTPHLQIHYPHNEYSDEVLGRCLVDLRRRQKILSIGLGNCSVDMIESMQRFLSDYSGDVIRSVQMEYSLINRRIESFLLPYCQARGILVIAYSPLGQSFKKLYKPILSKIAGDKHCSPAQVALAWLLSKEGVLPIPRTNNIEHLETNLQAVKIELTQQEVMEIEDKYPIG